MRTKVVKVNRDLPEFEQIKQAADILNKGGLVVFPTETVYGLAANARNKKAMQRLFEVKQRPKDKPFSLLIPNVYDIDKFAVDVLPFAYRLADRFWPGPLTLVLKTKNSENVGLRLPKHRGVSSGLSLGQSIRREVSAQRAGSVRGFERQGRISFGWRQSGVG